MTTVVKIENTHSKGGNDEALHEVVVVVYESQNIVVETHVIQPGESKEITIYGDRAFNVSKRWRDATPEAPKATTGQEGAGDGPG